jgi:DNA-directed RNA polymerase subunit RPC12/RpoP
MAWAAAPRLRAPSIMQTFICPVHPDVQSDRPLQCPRCGMRLERLEERPTTTSPRAGKQQPTRER